MAACTALVCGEQSSMPGRLGHWHSQISNVCSRMIGQGSDNSAMSSHKILPPTDPMSYLCSVALRIWTFFWRREGSTGMDMWNTPMVQSRLPLRPKMTRKQLTEGLQRVEVLSYRPAWLTYLGIWYETCHACSKPLTWKGAHWCGCCPCTCTLIKNPMMMMMMMMTSDENWKCYSWCPRPERVQIMSHHSNLRTLSKWLFSFPKPKKRSGPSCSKRR